MISTVTPSLYATSSFRDAGNETPPAQQVLNCIDYADRDAKSRHNVEKQQRIAVTPVALNTPDHQDFTFTANVAALRTGAFRTCHAQRWMGSSSGISGAIQMSTFCPAPLSTRSAGLLAKSCAFLLVALSTAQCFAAQITLSGFVQSSNVPGSPLIGAPWLFVGTYTGAGTPAVAFSAATFTVGGETWSLLAANNPGTVPPTFSGLTMLPTPGRLQVGATFRPASVPGGLGSLGSVFSLSIDGVPVDSSGFATEANVNAIVNTAPFSQQGSFTLANVGPAFESLTLQRAVPEPSAFAMLAGVLAVSAGRIYRRRQRTTAAN